MRIPITTTTEFERQCTITKGLVPVSLGAQLSERSRKRLYQLLEAERLDAFTYGGFCLLSLVQLEEWKGGRR